MLPTTGQPKCAGGLAFRELSLMNSKQSHFFLRFNRSFPAIIALPLTGFLACLCVGRGEERQSEKSAPQPLKQLTLNLDKAVGIDLPATTKDLVPATFNLDNERQGWVIRLPGNRPIATPAYADGRIFVGGGYGSHEFYALDAETGRKVWEMKTSDDGPTAAVVEDGCVAFNTESCTVIVVDAATGRLLWQEWLGDPLMSQPAIAKGKLLIAYPAGQRKGNALPNGTAAPFVHATSHRLLCADLKTGKHLWEADITSDVISAPVVEGDQVFLTCFDGTSFCFDLNDGALVWKKQNSGTSAPLPAGGKLIMTQKRQVGNEGQEGLVRVDIKAGETQDQTLLAGGKADYLRAGSGGNVPLKAAQQNELDSSVGFAQAPASAHLGAASENVGVQSVVAGWAYQGARAAYANGQMFNARGNLINCVGFSDGKMSWQLAASGNGVDANAHQFAPPALGKANMYLCSAAGHLLGLRQSDGQVLFDYATRAPMTFQPALAQGRLFAGTTDGRVICVNLKEKDADGWYAWGGNAQHNRKP
jgi:outer membrane protein assembly factor BamB